MKQKKLLTATAVLLVGSFGLFGSKIAAALEAKAFSVNTVVNDDSVEFNVESKNNSNENVSIMVLDKDTKAIKYLDQAKLNEEVCTFSTVLEEGNYEGVVNIADNKAVAIDTFIVSKNQTEIVPPVEELPPTEDNQNPENPGNDSDNTNKPSNPGNDSDNTNKPSNPGNSSDNTNKPSNPGNGSNNTNKPSNSVNSSNNTQKPNNGSNNTINSGMSLNTTQNQENVVSQNNNDTQNTDDNKTQEETIKDESKDSEDEMISNVVEISENTAKVNIGLIIGGLIILGCIGLAVYMKLTK